MANLLIAQSGGPTAAINATVSGAVEEALSSGKFQKIYGAKNGIKGVLEGRLVEIGERLADPRQRHLLETTPAAALGSCRLRLKAPEQDAEKYEKILSILRAHDISCFIYIGGNDSMDTVLRLSQYFAEKGIEDIRVMGAPKTIDNDLPVTDHTPGFGSAAKYIAASFAEIGRDCAVYDMPAVTVVEVMGRNAGWLTASSALARRTGGRAPSLIYLPEAPFDAEEFIKDVREQLEIAPAVVVAVSEGIRDRDGRYAAESYQSGVTDVFGHRYLAGTAKFLSDLVREKIGCKTRAVELNLMQRCAAHLASQTDLEESRRLGAETVRRALSGESGRMTVLRRVSETPYRIELDSVDIAQVANGEKLVPREWINERGNDVLPACVEYIAPLICGEVDSVFKDGLPVHFEI